LRSGGHTSDARRAYGFRAVGAWVNREENRFVWLVACDPDDDFAEREAAYYASPERAAIQPDPAQLLTEIVTTMLESVDG
jgi:hypothetical protein